MPSFCPSIYFNKQRKHWPHSQSSAVFPFFFLVFPFLLFQLLMLNLYTFILATFRLLIQISFRLCPSLLILKNCLIFPLFPQMNWICHDFSTEVKYLTYEFLHHWAIFKPVNCVATGIQYFVLLVVTQISTIDTWVKKWVLSESSEGTHIRVTFQTNW